MNIKKRLRSRADNLWYKLLLKESCEVCGCSALQVHHFFYKGNYGHLIYDLDNGITLCLKCHFLLHHQDPKRWNIEDKIIKKRGIKWLARLTARAFKRLEGSYLTEKYYKTIITGLEEGVNLAKKKVVLPKKAKLSANAKDKRLLQKNKVHTSFSQKNSSVAP